MGIILSLFGIIGKQIRDTRHARNAERIRRNYAAGNPQPPPQRTPQHQPNPRVTPHATGTSAATTSESKANLGRNSNEVPASTLSTPNLSTSQRNPASTSAPLRRHQLPDGTMATDDEYMAFLNKANQDLDEAKAHEASASNSSKIELKTQDTGIEVPAQIREATKDAFYISDADEPFETVALKYGEKDLPDGVAFAKLVDHPSPDDADVSVDSVDSWDARGQYKELVEAIKKATDGGDIKVYRVPLHGARVEYWVLGREKGGKLVGAKALAIES